MMSRRSPKNVIVANRATERFAAHCERPPTRTWVPVHGHPPTRFGRVDVSLRVFSVREPEVS